MNHLKAPHWAGRIAAALLVTAALAGRAGAAGNCADLPSPIYGIGGSAQKPLLAAISKGLASLPPPDTATIVFQAPGACFGIYTINDDSLLTGTASYWDATGVEQTCSLQAGHKADFGNMANSAALCAQAPSPLPPEIGDYQGPVDTVAIIVPNGSSQVSISAAGAYFAFGFGSRQAAAPPWTVDAEIIIRDINSAVLLLLGQAIGLDASKFKGTDSGSNGNSVKLVGNAPVPENAIGFVSGSTADASRATVHTLAYQHTDQSCGYLPDSTSTALDKRNVREGRYFIWTAQHFFARVDPVSKQILSPGAAKLIGYVTGELTPPAGFDFLQIAIRAGTIPKCAMHVWRTGDLGPESSYDAPAPCGCFFDSLTGGSSCQSCATASCPSSAPACRRGYCEVK
jgi:hypothetical protein